LVIKKLKMNVFGHGLKDLVCSVCGHDKFEESEVLWPELISSWQLSKEEARYINRQQGCHCAFCKNNLRSLALAKAILKTLFFEGTLLEFCQSSSKHKLLEINRAGNLTDSLKKLIHHRLIEYPKFDMTNLDIESGIYDLVVHSDTLEHIANPERALSECSRVLSKDGKCIFTTPIIVERMTRSRAGLAPSYHGQSNVQANDQLVHTEFGANFWQTVLKAGFSSCEIFCLEYPSALAIIATK